MFFSLFILFLSIENTTKMRKITNLELHRPSAEQFAQMNRLPVTVVLDNVRSAQNVGAFFRTCDAFAIEHIALCGITSTPPSRDIHKTALGAEMTIDWSYYENTVECVEKLKAEGYTLLGRGRQALLVVC